MTRKLDGIASRLREGKSVQSVTVRNFLEWFGAQRRGYWIVEQIREELASLGITTDPDFNSVWIDSDIEFRLLEPQEDSASTEEPHSAFTPEEAQDATDPDPLHWVRRDAGFSIGKLDAANRAPVSVKPDSTLAQVVTLMLSNDYSQLPVMTSARHVKGMISWKSLGSRLVLRQSGRTAQELMDLHLEVRFDSSIFDVIDTIVKYDYVLVRGSEGQISGIVTASDLSKQFQGSTEPFLLLSEIENIVRNLIGSKLSVEQLQAARDPGDSTRQIEGVSSLNFGEYIRLVEVPEHWTALSLNIDRVMFCAELDKIRRI